MDIIAAAEMAKELMAMHGLDDWEFRFDNGKRRFGRCSPGSKLITLSIHLTHLNDEKEVCNTILHEIAHALAPKCAHHGPSWRRIAKSIGCTGDRCCNDAITPPGKWVGSCSVCGYTLPNTRHRRSNISCGRCEPRGYDPQFRIVWTASA
jgi:predicted SprT family Zn-dependent metalloprotease